MAVVPGILKGIGIAFLVVLAVILILVLLFLFVPIRYHLTEKGGSSETYRIEKTDPRGDLTVSWLLHFLHVTAGASYREKALSLKVTGRILGIPVLKREKDIAVPKQREEAGEEDKKEETKKEEEPEKKGSDALEAVKSFYSTLKEDGTGCKKEKIKKHLGGILKNILPREGNQRVWFGTGDPFQTAEILGAAAFFYPLYKNTIEIIPDMPGSSLYSEGEIKGRIFPGSILYHGAVLYFDKDVKKLLHRIKEKKDGKL